MLPRRIAGATHRFTPPSGHVDTPDRQIRDLYVRVADGVCLSAWEPTPEELAILNAGGSVILQVLGHQPPVALSAAPSVEEG